MKLFCIFSTAAAIAITGCTTHQDLATYDGARRVYSADFDQVWHAAVDAAQKGGFQVVNADRDHGYIGARRTMLPARFGEDLGIWVQQTGPTTTEARVLGRDASTPAFSLRNWENQIQQFIATNLTREVPAVGSAPRQVIIEQGNGASTVVIPRSGETVVVPPATGSTHEAERQVESLRLRQQTGERALANEVDETKREMLQREVDRLREDIRLQENRLRDLERELK